MKVNLKDLKYKKLRKVFGDIEVYNPTKEQRRDIEEKFVSLSLDTATDEESVEIELKVQEVFKEYLPMFSNIDYDDLSVEEVEEILTNPSEDLRKAISEVYDIINELFTGAMDKLLKMIRPVNEIMDSKDLSEEQKTALLEKMNFFIEEKNKVDE